MDCVSEYEIELSSSSIKKIIEYYELDRNEVEDITALEKNEVIHTDDNNVEHTVQMIELIIKLNDGEILDVPMWYRDDFYEEFDE